MSISELFTSREIATFIWIAIFFVWMFTKSEVRVSLLDVLRSFLALWKFFLLLLLYVCLIVLLLYKFSVWDFDLLKETVYWVFGWSLIAFINSNKFHIEKEHLRKTMRDIFNITVLIAFLVNFYTFPLWFELILVPFAVTLNLMAFFSGTKEEYKAVFELLGYIQITFGTAIMVFCISEALVNIKTFTSFSTLNELLLPVYLSLLFLPFLYVSSWYAQYEQKKIRERYLRKI